MTVGLAVALAACAGESAESVEAAIAEAAPTLAYVEASEAPCVASSVIRTVGYDELLADGYTSDSIRSAPADSIAEILRGNASADLRDEVALCLDLDALISAELVVLHGGAALTCEASFAPGDELVDAFVDARLADESAEFSVEDSTGNRDALRPCLDEATFGTVFGLDARADLEIAIDEALEGELRSDDEPCAGPALIEHLGSVEVANSAGIRVEAAQLVLDDLELDRVDRQDLLTSIFDCSELGQRLADELRVEQPVFSGCVIESLEMSEVLRIAIVEAALDKSASNSTNRFQDEVLNRCLSTRIATLFDPPSASTIQFEGPGAHGQDKARYEGSGAYLADLEIRPPESEKYGWTEVEYQCAAGAVVERVDLGRLYMLQNSDDPDTPSPEQLELWGQRSLAYFYGFEQCIADDLYRFTPYIDRAGFSIATTDCVRASVGDLSNSRFAAEFPTSEDLLETFQEGDRIRLVVNEALASCYSFEEQQLFDDVSAWLRRFGSEPQ